MAKKAQKWGDPNRSHLDTHDYFDPKVRDLFEGVDHIITAATFGLPWLILQLEEIAPVTAVTGNTDESGINYKETELVQLGAAQIFSSTTLVDPKNLDHKSSAKSSAKIPDVVGLWPHPQAVSAKQSARPST
jgi:predicted phosphodiesterase